MGNRVDYIQRGVKAAVAMMVMVMVCKCNIGSENCCDNRDDVELLVHGNLRAFYLLSQFLCLAISWPLHIIRTIAYFIVTIVLKKCFKCNFYSKQPQNQSVFPSRLPSRRESCTSIARRLLALLTKAINSGVSMLSSWTGICPATYER